MQLSPEDRAAFTDARIAAVHAGLKLNADQEKLWPPVETAVRDFAKLRIDRANARMNARPDDSQDAQKPRDPVARLRERADDMATTAAAMKKIADAADPLYKTLDDGQKRRLAILTHMEGRLRRQRLAAPRLRARHGCGGDGIAAMIGMTAGMMAMIGAARNGSEPGRFSGSTNRSKSRRIPAAFAVLTAVPDGRENPPGLLDIGGSLC